MRALQHECGPAPASCICQSCLAGPLACKQLLQHRCSAQGERAVPRVCQAIPEGTALPHQKPGRLALNDRDAVNRTFLFLSCQVPEHPGEVPEATSVCHNSDAQAPFLCLEQSQALFAARFHCTCWERLDWTGLSRAPHSVPSISQAFPLDKQYPTTPRDYGTVYGAQFPPP